MNRSRSRGSTSGDVLEALAVLVLQAAPRLDECVSVCRQIDEVPIEAALGDAEPLAEPVDAKRSGAAVGEEGEPGLDPVVNRQPAAGTARRGHGRQHTVTSCLTSVKISEVKELPTGGECCCNRGRR